ncbi:10049_t:CDS:1, partial [Cetraspora pellucida]
MEDDYELLKPVYSKNATNEVEKFKYYLNLAANDLFELGNRYRYGYKNKVKKDGKKAFVNYLQSANIGH